MAGDYAIRMEKLVRENNPGWKPAGELEKLKRQRIGSTYEGIT